MKLRESNFISVMADGGTDFGTLEEVLVYVCYLDWKLGNPVSESGHDSVRVRHAQESSVADME